MITRAPADTGASMASANSVDPRPGRTGDTSPDLGPPPAMAAAKGAAVGAAEGAGEGVASAGAAGPLGCGTGTARAGGGSAGNGRGAGRSKAAAPLGGPSPNRGGGGERRAGGFSRAGPDSLRPRSVRPAARVLSVQFRPSQYRSNGGPSGSGYHPAEGWPDTKAPPRLLSVVLLQAHYLCVLL